MSKIDIVAFEKELDTLSTEDLTSLYYKIADYEEVPVGIQEFIESEEFLGNSFPDKNGKPGKGFYPYWMGVLKEIYPSPIYSPYFIIFARGSIGRGKSVFSDIVLAYEIHKLLCLNDPQQKLGVIPSTRLVFALMNVTLSLTSAVGWDQLSQFFSNSPYFNSKIDLNRKIKGKDTLLPKRIDVDVGSRIQHGMGKAIVSAVLDEAGFDILNDQVIKNFQSLIARMQSRFMEQGGSVPGKLVICSSESEKGGSLNKLAERYKGQKGVYIDSGPLWEIRPWLYSGKTFKVFIGTDAQQPQILTSEESIIENDSNIIQVPEEHRIQFESDIYGSLRDLAGIATTSSRKFMPLRDRISNCLTMNSIFDDVVSLDFDNPEDSIQSKLKMPLYFANPIQARSPRYIHIDTALSGDKLGISGGSIVDFIEHTVKDNNTLLDRHEMFPKIQIEWSIGVIPTPGKQIPLYKIREFIFWMSSQGYNIGKVTADGYQCFTGDTKVSLLNGEEIQIKDLEGKEEFWVYSCDKEGNVVPGRGYNCRKTGEKAPILKVTLDNGEEIRCTYNHKFLMRDGSYIKAKDLKEYDSLMPLYRRESFKYEQFYNNKTKQWKYTHVTVGRFKYPDYKPSRYNDQGNIIHHLDFNKKNNSPDNLEFCINQKEHMERFHKYNESMRLGILKKWQDKEWKEYKSKATSEQLKKQWLDPKYKELMLRGLQSGMRRGADNLIRREWASKRAKERNLSKETHPRFKKDLTTELVIEKYKELKCVYKVAEYFGVHRETIRNRLGDYPRFPNNHKVIKIENAGFEDVYDIEVDEYHNFALTAGVFVHNSAEMLQLLTVNNYVAELTSVDRTMIPYITLRDTIYQNRLVLPKNEVLKKELFELEKDSKNSKIDHPEDGSKDLADSVCGVVFNLTQDANRYQTISQFMEYNQITAEQKTLKDTFWGPKRNK